MTRAKKDNGEGKKGLRQYDDDNGNEEYGEKDASSDEDENEGVPMDTGYAWIITLNVFIIQTVNFGFNRSLSVLLVDIKEEFDSSLTVVALTFTLLTLTSSIASLVVSNTLMSKFSCRTLSIVGSVIGAIAISLMSLAPNISIFLSIFILQGIAFGILLVCPNAMVGYYFKKRRGLATSLCNTGFCISYIIYPLVTEFLRSEYGLRGCLLILSAVQLNLVACSMTLTPPEMFKKRYYTRKRILAQQKSTAALEASKHVNHNYSKNQKYDAVITVPNGPLELGDEESAKLLISKIINNDLTRVKEMTPTNDAAISCSFVSATSIPIAGSPTGSFLQVAGPRKRTTSDASSLFERQLSVYTSQQSVAVHSDMPYYQPDEDQDLDAVSTTKDIAARGKGWEYYVSKIFDVTLFRFYRFRMYTLFIIFTSFNVYLLNYMPFIAIMAGLSKSEAAFLMTVSGFMDLLARLVLSFSADFRWFSASKVVAFSLFVQVIVCHGARVITSYQTFVAFAVIIGTFGGIRQTLSSVQILDYVGVELFAKGFGIMTTVNTLVLSSNHPIIGALLDTTGSFVIPLHYVGTMLIIAAVIMLTEPFCKRLDARRKRGEEEAVKQEATRKKGETC